MSTSGFNFKIFTKKEYDEFFNEIHQLPYELSPEEIVKEIQKRIEFSIVWAQNWSKEHLESLVFYRARPVDNPLTSEQESNPSSFSYPPTADKMGRANRIGQQVFYTSLDAHTALHEKAEQITLDSSIVYISKWELKNLPESVLIRPIFMGIPDEEGNTSAIISKIVDGYFEKLLHNFPLVDKERFIYGQKCYADLFTTEKDDLYHITSAIAYHMMVKALEVGADMPILAYPSIPRGKKSINFAFRKDFTEKYFHLKEVDKVIVTQLDENITYQPIGRAIVQNGRLEWYDFDIEVEIRKENTLVTQNNAPPGQKEIFRPINLQEDLTKGGREEKFSLKSYLEQFEFDKEELIDNFAKTSCEIPDLIQAKKIVEFASMHINEPLYLSNSISESERITSIAVPLIYTFGFIKKRLAQFHVT